MDAIPNSTALHARLHVYLRPVSKIISTGLCLLFSDQNHTIGRCTTRKYFTLKSVVVMKAMAIC